MTYEKDWDRRRRIRDRLICEQCGDPARIFHHRDPTTKTANVGWMFYNTPWDKVVAEIEKCDIVCRRCHAACHPMAERPNFRLKLQPVVEGLEP